MEQTEEQILENFKNDPEYKRMNKRISKILKKAKRKKLMREAFQSK